MAEDYGWLNPHLSLDLVWNGITLVGSTASDPTWRKWQPCDPTSPHWYDAARLRRLMGAYIARDEDHGRDQRTVREFISEFRGAEWQREAETRAGRGPSPPTGLTRSPPPRRERLRSA